MKSFLVAIALSMLALKLVSLLPIEAASDPLASIAVLPGAGWAPPVAAAHNGPASRDANPLQPVPANSGAASAQVVVSAQVQPVRLIVVDDAGDLLQVWSNSDEPARLEARRGSRTGQEISVDDALRAAFARIAPTIPSGARGLVYQRAAND